MVCVREFMHVQLLVLSCLLPDLDGSRVVLWYS